jgi:hypothetical protein
MRDMNYGATELSGVIASAKKLKDTEEEIMAYVNYTNRAEDYAILTGPGAGGRSRSRSRRGSSSRKSKVRKTRTRK